MLRKNYIVIILLVLGTLPTFAQKEERDLIRKGNRAFKDSIYDVAETSYRKALEVNPKSTIAMFNLGNTLMLQNKLQESMEEYVSATKLEKDKNKLSQNFHNIGVIFHSQKDYIKAIEAYKEALRNNPADDETRYNLALAQKMLKDQENSQQDQEQQKNNEQKEQKQQSENSQQQRQGQSSNPERKENEMSKENAEQLLNSVMQDEDKVQKKVKKQQINQGHQLEKDW